MKKWEYLIDVYYADKNHILVDHLNDLGKDGWEVFRVDSEDSSYEDQDGPSGYCHTVRQTTYRLWLKRENG